MSNQKYDDEMNAVIRECAADGHDWAEIAGRLVIAYPEKAPFTAQGVGKHATKTLRILKRKKSAGPRKRKTAADQVDAVNIKQEFMGTPQQKPAEPTQLITLADASQDDLKAAAEVFNALSKVERAVRVRILRASEILFGIEGPL